MMDALGELNAQARGHCRDIVSVPAASAASAGYPAARAGYGGSLPSGYGGSLPSGYGGSHRRF